MEENRGLGLESSCDTVISDNHSNYSDSSDSDSIYSDSSVRDRYNIESRHSSWSWLEMAGMA